MAGQIMSGIGMMQTGAGSDLMNSRLNWEAQQEQFRQAKAQALHDALMQSKMFQEQRKIRKKEEQRQNLQTGLAIGSLALGGIGALAAPAIGGAAAAAGGMTAASAPMDLGSAITDFQATAASPAMTTNLANQTLGLTPTNPFAQQWGLGQLMPGGGF